MTANADVPLELVEALSRTRKVCPKYNTYKGCQRGRKCKMIHGDNDEPVESLAILPFVASHALPDGSSHIVSRPPLAEAWTAFFQSHTVPNRLHKGEETRLAVKANDRASDGAVAIAGDTYGPYRFCVHERQRCWSLELQGRCRRRFEPQF